MRHHGHREVRSAPPSRSDSMCLSPPDKEYSTCPNCTQSLQSRAPHSCTSFTVPWLSARQPSPKLLRPEMLKAILDCCLSHHTRNHQASPLCLLSLSKILFLLPISTVSSLGQVTLISLLDKHQQSWCFPTHGLSCCLRKGSFLQCNLGMTPLLKTLHGLPAALRILSSLLD